MAAQPLTNVPNEAARPAPARVIVTKVFVRGLKVEAWIGVYDHEHGRQQPLVIDVELDVAASHCERIGDTVNYETIGESARAIADAGHIDLVETFAERLAQALAPRIRVNAIGPGPTLPSVHQAPGEFEAEAAGTLLQRHADPQDLAAALRYLIDARAVTGQMIAVDAGQHLAWRTPDIVAP